MTEEGQPETSWGDIHDRNQQVEPLVFAGSQSRAHLEPSHEIPQERAGVEKGVGADVSSPVLIVQNKRLTGS
jgi:hypothetical protein